MAGINDPNEQFETDQSPPIRPLESQSAQTPCGSDGDAPMNTISVDSISVAPADTSLSTWGSNLDTLLNELQELTSTTPVAPVVDQEIDNQLVQVRLGVATSLFMALRCRDPFTAAHALRVALMVSGWCMKMGVEEHERDMMEVAALLHDLGVIGIPDKVLHKPDRLDSRETTVVERSRQISAEILRSACSEQTLLDIIEHIPTRYDGSREGYTLSDKDIPLGSRMIAIVESFDSMTSDTVYRKGRSYEEGFKELLRYSGKQFDPELVERFIRSIARRQQSSVPVLGKINKQAALQLGSEMQRLAETVDARDFAGLQALAARLGSTASKAGVTPIAEAAEQLDACLGQETDDLKEVLNLTQNLISLCRATQRTFLDDASALVNS